MIKWFWAKTRFVFVVLGFGIGFLSFLERPRDFGCGYRVWGLVEPVWFGNLGFYGLNSESTRAYILFWEFGFYTTPQRVSTRVASRARSFNLLCLGFVLCQLCCFIWFVVREVRNQGSLALNLKPSRLRCQVRCVFDEGLWRLCRKYLNKRINIKNQGVYGKSHYVGKVTPTSGSGMRM